MHEKHRNFGPTWSDAAVAMNTAIATIVLVSFPR
jgi:hypothetical protein